jgi:Uma2 family endonuclease
MSAPNPKIRFSYADYRSLVESTDKRYELLDGACVMVPAPTTRHQQISRNLEFLLLAHVRQQRLGTVLDAPIDVIFGVGEEREVVQPDIVFIRTERRSIVTEPAIQGAPDLIVEILSPGTEIRDRGYKRTLYARYGVREYWIVDPKAQQIDVLVLGAAGFDPRGTYGAADRLTSPLFPLLELFLDEVFCAD